jgi:hypothetical protein
LHAAAVKEHNLWCVCYDETHCFIDKSTKLVESRTNKRLLYSPSFYGKIKEGVKKVSILNPKAAGWLVQPKKLSTKKKGKEYMC